MRFVIIGMGQFGRALALQLTQNGYEVTVLDQQENVIAELKDHVAYALTGDAMDERVLRQMDLVGGDLYVIVAIGEGFERSILITAQLKELGVKNLYVRSANHLHSNVLKLIGVKDLFRVEDVAAKQLVSHFQNEGLMRLRKIDRTHALAEVNLPASWVGKKLQDVQLRTNYQLNLLTLRRGMTLELAPDDDVLAAPEQPVIDTPSPNLIFERGDILVLFGKDEALSRFVELHRL